MSNWMNCLSYFYQPKRFNIQLANDSVGQNCLSLPQKAFEGDFRNYPCFLNTAILMISVAYCLAMVEAGG